MKILNMLSMISLVLIMMSGNACASPGVNHKENVSYGHIQEHGVFHLACYAPDGSLKWQEDADNALANEGENAILGTMFQGATIPTTYYVRLYNNSATPALTSTLAALSSYELASANGYTPSMWPLSKNSTDWPSGTFSLTSSHWQIQSKNLTLTASGAVANIRWVCLATTSDNTGKLMAYAQTSADRTLASGDTLTVSYTVRLQ